jgi:hypothetical protein
MKPEPCLRIAHERLSTTSVKSERASRRGSLASRRNAVVPSGDYIGALPVTSSWNGASGNG